MVFLWLATWILLNSHGFNPQISTKNRWRVHRRKTMKFHQVFQGEKPPVPSISHDIPMKWPEYTRITLFKVFHPVNPHSFSPLRFSHETPSIHWVHIFPLKTIIFLWFSHGVPMALPCSHVNSPPAPVEWPRAPRSRTAPRCWRSTWEIRPEHGNMGKPWENHGKTIGKW